MPDARRPLPSPWLTKIALFGTFNVTDAARALRIARYTPICLEIEHPYFAPEMTVCLTSPDGEQQIARMLREADSMPLFQGA